MTMLFHTERLRLISENNSQKDAKYTIIGFPFDSTETNTPGQRFGPSAIRDKFLTLESGNMTTKIFDAGDIVPVHGNAGESIKKLTETIDDILRENPKTTPILLGGEHTATLGAINSIKKTQPNIQVISLDAHYDLKDDVQGEKISHATVMRKIAEQKIPVTILGARTGSEEEIRYAERINTSITKIDPKIPVYLSIDIDFFDPSVAPGVGDPQSGGFFKENFIQLLKDISRAKIIGADIVETNPMIENSITPHLAAECLLDILKAIDIQN